MHSTVHHTEAEPFQSMVPSIPVRREPASLCSKEELSQNDGKCLFSAAGHTCSSEWLNTYYVVPVGLELGLFFYASLPYTRLTQYIVCCVLFSKTRSHYIVLAGPELTFSGQSSLKLRESHLLAPASRVL